MPPKYDPIQIQINKIDKMKKQLENNTYRGTGNIKKGEFEGMIKNEERRLIQLRKKKEEKAATVKEEQETLQRRLSASNINRKARRNTSQRHVARSSTSEVAATENKKKEAAAAKIATENKKKEAAAAKIATENKKKEAAKIATENKKKEAEAAKIATENKKKEAVAKVRKPFLTSTIRKKRQNATLRHVERSSTPAVQIQNKPRGRTPSIDRKKSPTSRSASPFKKFRAVIIDDKNSGKPHLRYRFEGTSYKLNHGDAIFNKEYMINEVIKHAPGMKPTEQEIVKWENENIKNIQQVPTLKATIKNKMKKIEDTKALMERRKKEREEKRKNAIERKKESDAKALEEAAAKKKADKEAAKKKADKEAARLKTEEEERLAKTQEEGMQPSTIKEKRKEFNTICHNQNLDETNYKTELIAKLQDSVRIFGKDVLNNLDLLIQVQDVNKMEFTQAVSFLKFFCKTMNNHLDKEAGSTVRSDAKDALAPHIQKTKEDFKEAGKNINSVLKIIKDAEKNIKDKLIEIKKMEQERIKEEKKISKNKKTKHKGDLNRLNAYLKKDLSLTHKYRDK